MIIEEINNSYIYYTDNQVIHTREYYNYAVSLFKDWLLNKEIPINLIVGNYNFNFNNNHKTIRADIQCEHTLVKDGGRSVGMKIYGNVKHSTGNYLVRIDKYDYINSLDIIIEYSQPNIVNISSSGQFDNYLSRILYIAPTLYDLNFDKSNKTDIITLFTKSGNERRTKILIDMDELNIGNKLVDSCFSSECILELYKNSKIMVNVHQTDHHHTFEELRILPAISNGVIIISEDVPLKEEIKYSEYIIWVDYDNIVKKTLEVMNNYDYYYNKIFGDDKLKNILYGLKNNNSDSVNNLKL